MKLQEANRALHTERIFQDRAKQKEIRDQYFATSHSIAIEEQLSGRTSTDYSPPPRPSYQFHQRRRLVEAFYGVEIGGIPLQDEEASVASGLSAPTSTASSTYDRYDVIADLAALCPHQQSLAQFRATRQQAAIIKKPLDDEEAGILPAICLSTQCLICFGNKHMDIDSRLKMFSTIHKCRQHVDRHLAKWDDSKPQSCPYPICDAQLDSSTHFKNHAAIAHNLFY